MELKLAQELANIYHKPLFMLWFDFQKAYGTAEWDRIIQTLEGYSCGLLETFWEHQKVVPK